MDSTNFNINCLFNKRSIFLIGFPRFFNKYLKLNLLKFWISLGLPTFTMNYLWVIKSKLGFSGSRLVKIWIFWWINYNHEYAKGHLVTHLPEISQQGECSNLFSFTFAFPDSTKELNFFDIFTFSWFLPRFLDFGRHLEKNRSVCEGWKWIRGFPLSRRSYLRLSEKL